MNIESKKERLNILFLCLPDVERAIGGVKQLYRHAEIIQELGHKSFVITENEGFRPGWFESKADTKCIGEVINNEKICLDNTILVMPETYAGANQSNLYGWDVRNFKKVIFNQNAYYTTRGQTMDTVDKFYNDNNVLHVLAISEDTYEYLNTIMGIGDENMTRIINSIEDYFKPSHKKEKIIHWMPRKNSEESIEVIKTLSKINIINGNKWRGEGLDNMEHVKIAERLNSSSIFLSFGSPEGFGLPVAEAMAAGNWVIGYTGMGARELFRYGASTEVEFGDWGRFGRCISKIIEKYELNERETELRIKRQSKAIKNLYSKREEEKSIEYAWDRIVNKFNSIV